MGSNKGQSLSGIWNGIATMLREIEYPTLETGTFWGIQKATVSNAAITRAVLAKERGIAWDMVD